MKFALLDTQGHITRLETLTDHGVAQGYTPIEPYVVAEEHWQAGGTVIAGVYSPPPVDREELRAAMPSLSRWRLNTIIDLEAGLRDKINAAIEQLPDPQRTIARNKLADVVDFERVDPFFDMLGSHPSIGKTHEVIDQMWAAGLALPGA